MDDPLDSLDQMAAMPAGNAWDSTPQPSQFPSRQSWVAAKAEDLSQRGVAYAKTPTGDVSEVTDWTGSPLTNADKANKIAYDTSGSPVDYSNPRNLRDPFEGVPTTTDQRTGDQYQIRNGLPWKWVGQDADVAQAAQEAQQTKLDQQTSSALEPMETQARRTVLNAAGQAKLSVKNTGAALSGLGVPLIDQSGQPIDLGEVDTPTLKSHIDQSFNAQYAAPEANARPIFGGGQYTNDAEALRKQIDTKKQQAMQLADQHGATLQAASDAQDAYEAIQQQRQTLQAGRLDQINKQRVKAGLAPVIPGISAAQPAQTAPTIPGIDTPQQPSAPLIPGLDTSQSAQQSQPQQGASEAVEAHNLDSAGSTPAPATPPITGIQNTLERIALEGAHGFDKSVEGVLQWAKALPDWTHSLLPVAWALGKVDDATGASKLLQERTAKQEAALAGQPEIGTSGHPESLAPAGAAGNVISKVAGGLIGQAPGIAMGGIPGLITLGTQAAAQSSAEAHDAAKAQGASDSDATKAGTIAAIKTLPSTALYAMAGSGTSKVLSKILPLNATPITRAAAALVGGTAANVLAGATGKAVVGDNPTPTLDDVVNSIVFAAHGSMTEHQQGQDLATARSIINGTHPEMAVMDGIAEGKVVQATPDQQASAAQYANAMRAVASNFIEKAGYSAPPAERPAEMHKQPEKMAQAREVEPSPVTEPPAQTSGGGKAEPVAGETLSRPSVASAGTAGTQPSATEPVAPPAVGDLQKRIADASALQEQAKKEGNSMAVALHGKEIADATNELEVLRGQSAIPSTNTPPSPPAPGVVQPTGGTPTPQTPAGTAKEEETSSPQVQPVAGAGQAPIHDVQDLRTFDLKDMEGKPQTPEADAKIKQNIVEHPDQPMIDGGESFADAYGRVTKAANEITDKAKDGSVVVTHNTVFGLLKQLNEDGYFSGETKGQDLLNDQGFREKYAARDSDTGDHFDIKTDDGRTIHIVRHGETEDNKAGLFRRPETPLTENGVQQANTLAKTFPNPPAIYSSHLPRAQHTASIIAGKPFEPPAPEPTREPSPPGADETAAQVSPNKVPLHIPGLKPTISGNEPSKEQAGATSAGAGSSGREGAIQLPPAVDSAAVREHRDELGGAANRELGASGANSFSNPLKKTKPSEAKQVALLYVRDNRKVLDALGVGNINFVGKTVAGSGIEFSPEAHRIDFSNEHAARAMDAVRSMTKDPLAGKAWAMAALDHEVIHAAQNKVAEAQGKTLEQLYTDGWKDSDLPDDLRAAAREYYGAKEWDAGGEDREWQRRAEAVRMIVENRWKGRITEQIYKMLEGLRDFFNKVLGLHPENAMLKRQVEATEEVLRRAGAEFKEPSSPKAEVEPRSESKAPEQVAGDERTPADAAPKAEAATVKPSLAEGAKARLGKSPQVHSILEELPGAKGDLPDERYFRVKNDRTGETQVVESRDLTPIRERSDEEKSAEKSRREAAEKELDSRLRKAGMAPDKFPDTKSKRAALRRYEGKQLGAANPMAADNEQQARWMTREAQARGFDSVGELLDKSPDSFSKLANQWRAFHHRQGGNYVQDGEARAINDKLYGPTNTAGNSQNTLGDAEAFLRGKDGTGSAFEGRSRKEQRAQLVQWGKDRGILVSKSPFRLTGPRDVGGLEHHVFEVGNRWVKLTKGTGESFGYTIKNGEIANASALDYVSQLNLANQVLGDDVRLHGVWQDKHGNVSLITSQPDVAGSELDAAGIRKHMEDAGFESLGDSRFYRERDNLLVSDLHPGNAVEHGGALVPFDAHVSHPSDAGMVHIRTSKPLASANPSEPTQAAQEPPAKEQPSESLSTSREQGASGEGANTPKNVKSETEHKSYENKPASQPAKINWDSAGRPTSGTGGTGEVGKEGAGGELPAKAKGSAVNEPSGSPHAGGEDQHNEPIPVGIVQAAQVESAETKPLVERLGGSLREVSTGSFEYRDLAERGRWIQYHPSDHAIWYNLRLVNRSASADYIRDSFTEELIHTAQGAVVRQGSDTPSALERLLDKYRGIAQELGKTETGRNILASSWTAYSTPADARVSGSNTPERIAQRAVDDPGYAFELERQLIQLRRNGQLTEQSMRTAEQRLREWFLKAVNLLKRTSENPENASPILKESIEKVEGLLRGDLPPIAAANPADAEKPEEGQTPSEKLIRQAENAGVTYSLETLKGMIRGDKGAMDKVRAMIREKGQHPIAAANPWDAMVRRATPGLDIVKDVKEGIQSLLLPTAIDQAHLEAAVTLGARLGEMHRRQEADIHDAEPERKLFERMGVANEKTPLEKNPGVTFMSAMSTGKPMSADLQKVADKISDSFDKRVQLLDQTGVPMTKVRENYFPGIWEHNSRLAFSQAMEEAQKRGDIPDDFDINASNPHIETTIKARVEELLEKVTGKESLAGAELLAKRPLEGNGSFKKPKVFDDIMTGVKYGLKPASNNPIVMRNLKLAEMDRFIMGNQAFNDFEAKGDMIAVNTAGQPMKKANRAGFNKTDWAKIDDKYGTIWRRDPDTGALIKQGERWAKKPVADILNNYLSSSLYNNRYFGTLYKAWMGMANALNQSQLGVGSAFHAGFTALESQISAGSNVLKDIYGVARGNRSTKNLLKTIGKLPTAMVENPMTGDKVLNAWLHPDGTMDPRIARIARAWELSGGGTKMEKGLETSQLDKMYSDWFSDHKIRAAMRSPIALVELLAKPIMEYLVPRQKLGVFAHLAQRIIDMNPDKTDEELAGEYRAAAMRTDARLGQVRYDRLFMHNAAKNVVQGLVRAPGWSGGTLGEILGSLKDTGKFFKEWKDTGKLPQNLPDRVAYTAFLMLGVAALNGLLTYAFSGKQPEGNDYMAFRTGREDENGNPERFMLPTYMKDVWAYWMHPGQTLLNKSHPLLSLFGELIHNKDYYGVQVRDTDANALKQAEQAGLHVVKAFTPFWMRGYQTAQQRGKGTAEKLAPLIGVMPAPKEMNQSPAYRLAAQINRDRIPAAPITEQQEEHRIARSNAVSSARRGDLGPMQKAIASGTLKPSDARSIQQKAALPPLAAQVKSLPLDQAERVWKVATLQERQQLAPIMLAKRSRAQSSSVASNRMFRVEQFQ